MQQHDSRVIRTVDTARAPSAGPAPSDTAARPVSEDDTAAIIARCFTPPERDPEEPIGQQQVQQSVLHLLRREVQLCLFGAISTESEALQRLAALRRDDRTPRALFATTIVLFAGIDLLGKFAYDTNSTARFKRFACEYGIAQSNREGAELYAFRSALAHSFGLVVEERGKKPRSVILELNPHRAQSSPAPAIVRGEYRWRLDIAQLFRNLVTGVQRYKGDLEKAGPQSQIRRDFVARYQRFGYITVGPHGEQ